MVCKIGCMIFFIHIVQNFSFYLFNIHKNKYESKYNELTESKN